jgi:hypothetical protein
MSEPGQEKLPNVPELAQGLEGFIDSGMATGSGNGDITHFAVVKRDAPCLDGSAIRRLGNGLVVLSDIFPERSDSDKKAPPSQTEAVMFLVAAENEANLRITGINPGARWRRRGRQQTEAHVPEQKRQRKIAKTQKRLASLGFSVGVSLSPPAVQEDQHSPTPGL